MGEIGWRITCAAIIVIFRVVRRRYRARWRSTHADAAVRRIDTKEKVLLGLTTLIGMGLCLLWLVTPWLDRAALGLPAAARVAGAVISAGGILLLAWVHRTLGDNWSPSLEVRRGHELVDRGPYALVRHPMYTAIGAVILGYGLTSSNAIVLFVSPIPFFTLVAVRMVTEERLLLEQFGETYRAYMRRTKRLVPFVV